MNEIATIKDEKKHNTSFLSFRRPRRHSGNLLRSFSVSGHQLPFIKDDQNRMRIAIDLSCQSRAPIASPTYSAARTPTPFSQTEEEERIRRNVRRRISNLSSSISMNPSPVLLKTNDTSSLDLTISRGFNLNL